MLRTIAFLLLLLPLHAHAKPAADQWYSVLLDGRKIGHFESSRSVAGDVVTTPDDAFHLLKSEMMFLDQEHLRLILLDTRNRVLRTPTLYIGSLNTSVVRGMINKVDYLVQVL